MIADHENPAEAVFLDGKRVDLTLVTMADDERGIIETLVMKKNEHGVRYLATGPSGQPITEELRGDVRIIMPMRTRLQ